MSSHRITPAQNTSHKTEHKTKRSGKTVKPFYIDKLKQKLKKKKLPSIDDLCKNTPENCDSALLASKEQILAKDLILHEVKLDTSKLDATSNCSLDTFELLDRLSTTLSHEMKKGISTTTLEIDNQLSTLHGTTVEISHYDTAPHSFHLDIFTTPQQQLNFSNQIGFLSERLTHILPQCKFYFAPPKIKQTTSVEALKKNKEEKINHSIEKIMD